MHKFTRLRFEHIRDEGKVDPDILDKAIDTAKMFYREDGPTAQPGVTPDGSVELQYLVDGTTVSILFNIDEDPEEGESGDYVYADNDSDLIFCGRLDDPEIVEQTRALLEDMSLDGEIISLDADDYL